MGLITLDFNQRNCIPTDDVASDKIMDFAGHDTDLEGSMWEGFLLKTPTEGQRYISASVNAYDATGSTIATGNCACWVLGLRVPQLENGYAYLRAEAAAITSGNNILRDWWLVRFQRENWHSPDDESEAWVNIYPFHKLPGVTNINSGSRTDEVVLMRNFENQTSYIQDNDPDMAGDQTTASDDETDLGFDVGLALLLSGVAGAQISMKQVFAGMSLELVSAVTID